MNCHVIWCDFKLVRDARHVMILRRVAGIVGRLVMGFGAGSWLDDPPPWSLCCGIYLKSRSNFYKSGILNRITFIRIFLRRRN